MILLRSLLIIFTMACSNSGNGEIVQSDGISSHFYRFRSSFDKQTVCPPNSYVVGASIRSSRLPKTSIIAISSIRLECSDGLSNKQDIDIVQLGKYYQGMGDWQDKYECRAGYAAGIYLYLAPMPTKRNNGDELEISDYVAGIKLVCAQGSEQLSYTGEVTYGVVTAKSMNLNCTSDQVMKGFGVRLQSIRTFPEGTHLNIKSLLL